MGIRLGPFDPMQLIFNLMNVLMRNNQISYEDAAEIIRNSLPIDMPEAEKTALLNSMMRRAE